ncbi:predicted protein [Nematostella vectensis]|uniref:Uncharacterized protein n=1 Tax=Nematostella vectensis TaxID=45351 RepID=A7T186_NEMVE|nr:predicted protein [Nematostella vectensis]|eukprot:XP_001622382.1 predicted protein [Nematostella vectensis]
MDWSSIQGFEVSPTTTWNRTGALFLGPRADNSAEFTSMALEAFESHVNFRRNFFPCDPEFVTEDMRSSSSFKDTLSKTRDELRIMQKELEGSVPFFSPRYKGHVNWDTLMPSNLAYITAMMYNQNNCATEGSPVTTRYEVEVGRDLCAMVGYKPHPSMGHVVAGGSLANVEAIWAARNLKFYALGLSDAIKHEDRLRAARTCEVYLPHKAKCVCLVDATNWELLNLDVDSILDLPMKVAQLCSISMGNLSQLTAEYMYEGMGPYEFHLRHNLKASPCCLGTSSAHVSLAKGNTILGLGKKHLIKVPLNEDARMDTEILRELLEEKLANQIPVISVICIMRTTEESAVDPLTEILAIREEMTKNGLSFTIHADGAWGGYFCSMLHPSPDPPQHADPLSPRFIPKLGLSSYTQAQLSALRHVDTVTIDPHKSGFCPYPGGAICYRDKRINDFLAVSSRVNYYHGDVMLGNVGIEGSKPGAAAAGIVMAHRVVGLHQGGYGHILAECMFASKLMYCMWTCLARDDDPFFVIPTKPLPPDRTYQEHIKYMRDNIIGRTNAEIAKNAEAMEYLREIGPDTLIPCFTWNLKGNTNVNLLNRMVEVLLADLSMSRDNKPAHRLPMVITASTHRHEQMSDSLNKLKQRLGVTDVKVHHDLVTAGQLVDAGDSRQQMVAYYAGRLTDPSRQYFAAIKLEFCNPSIGRLLSAVHYGNAPLVLRCVEKETIHDLLLGNGERKKDQKHGGVIPVGCYAGMPGGSRRPLMLTIVRVVDVARFEHFDIIADQCPESVRYFMYGFDDKAYIMHVPTKKLDFLQMAELARVPDGVTKVVLRHGVEISFPLLGSPWEYPTADPLGTCHDVHFIGENGVRRTTTIEIARKIWFDTGELFEDRSKPVRQGFKRSCSHDESHSTPRLPNLTRFRNGSLCEHTKLNCACKVPCS